MKLALDASAQQEMRAAYFDGAPGVLVSGIVWAIAALMCHLQGVERGIWTLLIGGVLISPVADLLTKALGRSASPPKGNALTALAAASTVWLIVCCAMAYGLSLQNPAWFLEISFAVVVFRSRVTA